jgi:hypothetical protein
MHEHIQSNIFVFKSKRPSILLLYIRGFELYGIHRLRDIMNGPNGCFEVSMVWWFFGSYVFSGILQSPASVLLVFSCACIYSRWSLFVFVSFYFWPPPRYSWNIVESGVRHVNHKPYFCTMNGPNGYFEVSMETNFWVRDNEIWLSSIIMIMFYNCYRIYPRIFRSKIDGLFDLITRMFDCICSM